MENEKISPNVLMERFANAVLGDELAGTKEAVSAGIELREAREALTKALDSSLTAEDARDIEIHVREIRACANVNQMPMPQANRIIGNLVQIRKVLAKILVPLKDNDDRLVTPAWKASNPEPALTVCMGGRDGECNSSRCPQLRDGEPEKSGRHCPIDNREET